MNTKYTLDETRYIIDLFTKSDKNDKDLIITFRLLGVRFDKDLCIGNDIYYSVPEKLMIDDVSYISGTNYQVCVNEKLSDICCGTNIDHLRSGVTKICLGLNPNKDLVFHPSIRIGEIWRDEDQDDELKVLSNEIEQVRIELVENYKSFHELEKSLKSKLFN